jgi:hypothetical protein
VRTLLHTPRTRGRSLAAATLGALALIGSLLVATPAQAINDTGTGGVFVSASGRVLDTKVGTGGYSTPMEPGNYRTVKIAGLAGIPDDGSAGAVSLNASVNGTDSNGTLFGRPDADTSRTMMLIYNGTAGEYVSNSAIVAVSAEGTIQVATETSARLILDVQGYYTSNDDGTAAGGFVPVAGKRIVDTRSGLGATKSTLAPGKSIDIQVAGTNGVPNGASAAVVNLLPINTTSSDGYLTPYATGTTRPGNALHYAPSTNTSIQAQVQLSADGKMTIYNGSSTINLVVDLQGYFTPGIGRVYNSTASGNTIFAKNETRSIQIAGRAGVPVMGSGINSVVLTLTAYHAGSEGRATVWADGADKPDTTSINFRNDEIRTNTVTIALGANGKISLNNVADPTHYLIDVQGWYADPANPTVTCDNGAVAGSWGTAQHSAESPVVCTVTAPAATESGQTLGVTANGLPIGEAPLYEAGPTTLTVPIPPISGAVTIRAAAFSDAGESRSTEYAFGLGDWTKASIVPTVADGFVVEPGVVLAPIAPELGLLPSDSQYKFTLTDLTTGLEIGSGEWSDESFAPETSALSRAHDYAWSVKIRAASSWVESTEISTPTWHFRIAAEGEASTPTPVDSEADANPNPDTATDASSTASGPDGGVFSAAKETVNGCTLSPDHWFKANFTPACNTHDRCYFSTSKTSRKNCDLAFGGNLILACQKAYKPKTASLGACVAVTQLYYNAVRVAGKGYYKGKGSKA